MSQLVCFVVGAKGLLLVWRASHLGFYGHCERAPHDTRVEGNANGYLYAVEAERYRPFFMLP